MEREFIERANHEAVKIAVGIAKRTAKRTAVGAVLGAVLGAILGGEWFGLEVDTSLTVFSVIGAAVVVAALALPSTKRMIRILRRFWLVYWSDAAVFEKTCATCHFSMAVESLLSFLNEEDARKDAYNVCRFNPPVVPAAASFKLSDYADGQHGQHKSERARQHEIMMARYMDWPAVKHDDWCGKWTRGPIEGLGAGGKETEIDARSVADVMAAVSLGFMAVEAVNPQSWPTELKAALLLLGISLIGLAEFALFLLHNNYSGKRRLLFFRFFVVRFFVVSMAFFLSVVSVVLWPW